MALQKNVFHGDVRDDFLKQRREKYCIHSKAVEQFHPDKYFDLENLSFPFYFQRDLVDIKQLSSKPLKYPVLAKGSLHKKKPEIVWSFAKPRGGYPPTKPFPVFS